MISGKGEKMCRFIKRFNFPAKSSPINIHKEFDTDDWKNAKSIKFGKGNPVATVLGQHYGNILYLAFNVEDKSLRQKDTVIICINSNKTAEPGKEDIQLRYEFKLGEGDGEGHSFYSKYDNEKEEWGDFQSPAPNYVSNWIYGHKRDNNWEAVIQIDFSDPTLSSINPKSFGLYFHVLDYNGIGPPAHYGWPISVEEETENSDYIPPHKQWAIGRFVKKYKLTPVHLIKPPNVLERLEVV
jgi:hypothetical protein